MSVQALGIALTALWLLAQDEAGPQPLTPIAGIAGFASASRIEFPGRETPHRLEAVYLFPDRARWRILAVGGRATERQLVYRLGEASYELPPGGARSRVFRDSSREKTLLQLELRRATMLWPDGFEWKDAPRPADGNTDPREKIRFARVEVQADQERQLLGTLKATLDGEGRPLEVEALDLLGREVETLAIDSWQELEGRTWPRRLSLYQGTRAVWHETIEEVRTHVYFVDAFFQPPDRRPRAVPAGGATWNVLSLDLQGITFRARELDAGTPWASALEQARAWIAEAASEVKEELDPIPTFELDDRGRPRRVFLRLARRTDTPPEGWTTIGDRPGLALVLAGTDALGEKPLAALIGALPGEARAGTPYCRVVPGEEAGATVQVYLPLESPAGR